MIWCQNLPRIGTALLDDSVSAFKAPLNRARMAKRPLHRAKLICWSSLRFWQNFRNVVLCSAMVSESLRIEAMPVTMIVFLRLCIALQCLLPGPAIKSSVGNGKPPDLQRSAILRHRRRDSHHQKTKGSHQWPLHLVEHAAKSSHPLQHSTCTAPDHLGIQYMVLIKR